jgi:toxin-antitoxin system PIN domain toxin
VALAFDAHPAHLAAMAAFSSASNARPACFCRSTQQSFLRLSSTPAMLRAYGVSGMTNAAALRTFEGFVANPAVAYREEPGNITILWPRVAGRSTASPKVWMDVYLAAFAIAGSMTMVTLDGDFNTYMSRGLDLVLIQAP